MADRLLDPIGPFVGSDFVLYPSTRTTIVLSWTLWAISIILGVVCTWEAWRQTREIQNPSKHAFVWMIWLELAVTIAISIQSWLVLLKFVHISFYYLMILLLFWGIQIQLLLQIIINRIRMFSVSQRIPRAIMIGTAVIVSLITISVFCIWIPAQLQVSRRYIHLNKIWDPIEKMIYLILNASLNAYFARLVQLDLIGIGLEQFKPIFRFNICIVVISILMDVMIISALSIPDPLIFVQFLAVGFLVKLELELLMARLIRKTILSKTNSICRNSLDCELFLDTDCFRSQSTMEERLVLPVCIQKPATVVIRKMSELSDAASVLCRIEDKAEIKRRWSERDNWSIFCTTRVAPR